MRPRMFHSVPFLLTCVLAAPGAGAEVVDSGPSGFTVRSAVEVPVSPGEAFDAAVDVRSWWDPEHTFSGDAANLRLKARAGGCLCEKLEGGGSVRHLTVVHVERGKLLRMTGGLGPLQAIAASGTLSLAFTPAGEATSVQLTYTVAGYRDGGLQDWAAPVDRVLALQLRRLGRLLETGSPDGG